MSYYPDPEDVLAQPDSARLLEVRRSFRDSLTAFALVLVLVTGIYFAVMWLPGGIFPATFPLVGGMSVRWLALLPAIVLLEIWRRRHDDLYVFGVHSVTHYEGRLSLHSSVPSLKYGDIKALTVRQNLIGRLFDFGNVELDSAAQDGAELSIQGVRAPVELAHLIEVLRENSAQVQASEAA